MKKRAERDKEKKEPTEKDTGERPAAGGGRRASHGTRLEKNPKRDPQLGKDQEIGQRVSQKKPNVYRKRRRNKKRSDKKGRGLLSSVRKENKSSLCLKS